MTAKTTALLTDPEPNSHIVYPSTDENRIAEAVGTFACAGLRKGEAVILVTTQSRRETIERHIHEDCPDVGKLERTGQLSFLNAEAFLSAFLANGMPDAFLFKGLIGEIIQQARLHPGTGNPRKVRIFGEMVSLLYIARNIPAAERLEQFWNEIVEEYSVALFCAYSLVARPTGESPLAQSLLDAHTHNISESIQ